MVNGGLKSKKILIVDDEPAIAQLLLMLLGTHGYDVEAVGTGQEALLKANANTDLILLDIFLPDYEGFKLCQRFKTSTHTRNIPIIILSDSTQSGDKLESFHLGADDYLSKPFEPEELFARMEAVLRRSHAFIGRFEQDQTYDIIHELRSIVDNQRIVPFFQPIYFLKPLRLLGLEVLGRPQTDGVLSNPEALFKAALRFGMYYEVEMIVWKKAIEISQRVLHKEHLFLNCSPYLIESDKLLAVSEMFNTAGMSPKNVFLELTERSAISEFNIFFDRLTKYREQGFRIAIDDIGAGYASLESIVQTKPEVVKIDRQIVLGLSQDLFKRSIIKLIVAFCREHGIICIAEGIETKMDLEVLIELGVEAGQGYYLYKPAGEIDLDAMRAITV